MSDWKNTIQKELVKNLIDQLYKLEAENEQLKKSNGGNTSAAANSTHIDEEEEMRRIKLKVFGPDEEER